MGVRIHRQKDSIETSRGSRASAESGSGLGGQHDSGSILEWAGTVQTWADVQHLEGNRQDVGVADDLGDSSKL